MEHVVNDEDAVRFCVSFPRRQSYYSLLGPECQRATRDGRVVRSEGRGNAGVSGTVSQRLELVSGGSE